MEDKSEHILGVIELKNKNLLTFSTNKTVKVYSYIEKNKNYVMQYKSIIDTGGEKKIYDILCP